MVTESYRGYMISVETVIESDTSRLKSFHSMFHYDQSLQQNDEFRCTQKEPLSSSWVNINGINFCSGGWQRYLFGLKAELGFKSDAEENYVLIEDPLLRLFDIWDIIFNKQVRLFRHQRRVYLSWLGNTVNQVANSERFGCK